MLGRHDIQPKDATDDDANDDSDWELGERELADCTMYTFLHSAIGSLDFLDMLIFGGDIQWDLIFKSLVLDTLELSVHIDLLDGESPIDIYSCNGNETFL